MCPCVGGEQGQGVGESGDFTEEGSCGWKGERRLTGREKGAPGQGEGHLHRSRPGGAWQA